jgi:hypothetical protein
MLFASMTSKSASAIRRSDPSPLGELCHLFLLLALRKAPASSWPANCPTGS